MNSWTKTIKYSHDDLKSYSIHDVDLLVREYLPDYVKRWLQEKSRDKSETDNNQNQN